jgi:hypothetical protein
MAIQKGQSKMDIQEKLATQGAQYEEKRNLHKNDVQLVFISSCW